MWWVGGEVLSSGGCEGRVDEWGLNRGGLGA